MSEKKRDGEIRKTAKKRNRRRRRRVIAFFAVLFLSLLCAAALLSVTVLFPIKSISVDGESVYSESDVIDASKIKIGDNIFMLPVGKTKEILSEALPQSGDISVKRVFPDTVKITVNTAVQTFFVVSDGAYFVTDASYKVTERREEAPEGCIQLKAEENMKMSLGKRAEFSADTEKLLNMLLGYCNEKQLPVSGIDVSDSVKLKLVLEGRILVLLGTAVDTEYKISHLAAMLPKMEQDAQGTVNLSGWTSDNMKASFRDEKINAFEFCTLKH